MKNAKHFTNIKKTALATALVATTFLSTGALTSHAAEITQNSAVKSATVNLETRVGSTFTVAVPTKVVLDSKTGAGDITIKVRGDIAPTESLSITPQSSSLSISRGTNSIALSETNSATTAFNSTATDNKRTFGFDELSPTADATYVSHIQKKDAAQTISAGTWQGTITYDVSLQ